MSDSGNPTSETRDDTKRIEVDIGAAFEMLKASPELCAAMNEMIGGPALTEAHQEIDRLQRQLADADAIIAAFCEHGEDIVYATGPFMDRVAEAQARHVEREKEKPHG